MIKGGKMHNNLSNIFIDNGLINLKDNCGRTPLFYSNDYLLTTSLLAAGADLYHLDNYGRTPLFYNWIHSKAIIDLFIQLGIDLNIIDSHGLTFMSYDMALLNPHIIINHKHLITNKIIKIKTVTPNSFSYIKLLLNSGFIVEFTPIVKLEFPQERQEQMLLDLLYFISEHNISLNNVKFIYKTSSSIINLVDEKKYKSYE